MQPRQDVIKVLIVDGSRIFRSLVEESLSRVNDMVVSGSTWSGRKALIQIEENRPDVVLLEVEMPEMNGLETLDEIGKKNRMEKNLPPIQVIMLSRLTQEASSTTIKALKGGAFDFVAKPAKNEATAVRQLSRTLVPKIRATRKGRVLPRTKPNPVLNHKVFQPRLMRREPQIILVGCSTGGPKALAQFLPHLSELTDLSILIVQHMPPTFTKSLAGSLDRLCRHHVEEAHNGQPVLPDNIYIAPGGFHMLLRRGGDGQLHIATNETPHENGCRPSVDVLFRSVVPLFNANILAYVLTGMGRDGCRGAAALKRAGAHVLVQDEPTSVVWGMPGSIVAEGLADGVYPINQLAGRSVALLPSMLRC